MKSLSIVAVLVAATVLVLAGAVPARASTCTAGGCHASITGVKFLHGPVAAEEAGAEGCVSCHTPAGPKCSSAKGGAFAFKTEKDRLCLLCHERGTGTQHTRARGRCLSCHSPHGSNKSTNMMRAE